MSYQVFECEPIETNAILFFCEIKKRGVVIDPGFDCVKRILSVVEEKGLTLEKILLTHSHWDHIAGIEGFLKEIDLPVFVHEEDEENVLSPGSDRLNSPIQVAPVSSTCPLKEGDEVRVGELLLKVLHTPGHSPGSVCFYAEEQKLLFSGDTLFKGSYGILSLPTAQKEKMPVSLKRLSKLPSDVKVVPGHGFSTTIGEEKWLSHAEEKIKERSL